MSIKALGQGRQHLLGLPILVKTMGIALGMTFFLAIVLVWQIDHSYFQLEQQELKEQARFVADVVSIGVAPMLQKGAVPEAQHLVDVMSKVVPATGTTITRLEVQTGDGEVLAHVAQPPLAGSTDHVFEAAVPLSGGKPGLVTATLSDGHIGFELGWHVRRITRTAAIIALLGLAAGWWLMRVVTRPIGELVQMANSARGGDYRARAPVRARDEVGQLAQAFNNMMDALQQKDTINRQLVRKCLGAEEELRKVLARELRDEAGQALASLVAGLAAIESGADPNRLPEMRALASKTLAELQALSLSLRPSTLEDFGLVSALQKFCRDAAERFQVKVDCSAVGMENTPRLAREIEVALYRIGLEAITNAVRHGQARSIEVLLQRKANTVLEVVEDDGRGFDASDWRQRSVRDDRVGLLGIEERAALLGGSLRLESRPGGGTSLFVEIPVEEPACA